MSSENDNFLFSTFTKNILDFHKSIRWVGIIDQDGIIIGQQYRVGLKPLLTRRKPRICNKYNN